MSLIGTYSCRLPYLPATRLKCAHAVEKRMRGKTFFKSTTSRRGVHGPSTHRTCLFFRCLCKENRSSFISAGAEVRERTSPWEGGFSRHPRETPAHNLPAKAPGAHRQAGPKASATENLIWMPTEVLFWELNNAEKSTRSCV